MRNWIRSILFFLFSLAVTVVLYICTNRTAQNDVLAGLALELSSGYQFRQIVVAVYLYLMGLLLVETLNVSQRRHWNYVLAFPAGILCWCLLSFLVTLSGIPYRAAVMLFFMLAVSGAAVFRICTSGKQIKWSRIVQSVLYFAGGVMIVSGGILTIFLSFDSAYFIMKYGQILAIQGGFSEIVAVWMQWTGLMPSYLSALAYMCGFENIFTIHHMLMLSFAGIFYLSIEEQIGTVYADAGKRRGISVLITVFLVLTAPFYLMAQFVISNTYFMVFLFLLVMLCYQWMEACGENKRGIAVLVGMTAAVLTLCRTEAVTVVCFLAVCLSTLSISSRKLFSMLLLPAGAAQFVYWGKIFAVAGVPDSDLLNVKTLGVLGAVYAATIIYLFCIRGWMQKLCGKYLTIVMIVTLAGANLLLSALFPEKAAINLDAEFYNIANEFWGPFPWIALLLCILAIRYAEKFETFDLIWLGYILFNFAVCMCRFNDLRKGYGDSYNRILCGVIPLFLWAMVRHYIDYKRKSDCRIQEERK